jgi:hypothetical protein
MTFDVEQGYIRHPDEIPATVNTCRDTLKPCKELQHSEFMGISLACDRFHATGSALDVVIPINGALFETIGFVSWCNPEPNGRFRVGVQFDDPDIAYSVRMIEQLCHIEAYRQRIESKEGRLISQESAAAEWIQIFAHDFPVCARTA